MKTLNLKIIRRLNVLLSLVLWMPLPLLAAVQHPSAPTELDRVLVVVNDDVITETEVNSRLASTKKQLVLEKIKNYHYPVCFDFPVGHQKNNFALKCGIKHRLKVDADKSTLTEIR